MNMGINYTGSTGPSQYWEARSCFLIWGNLLSCARWPFSSYTLHATHTTRYNNTTHHYPTLPRARYPLNRVKKKEKKGTKEMRDNNRMPVRVAEERVGNHVGPCYWIWYGITVFPVVIVQYRYKSRTHPRDSPSGLYLCSLFCPFVLYRNIMIRRRCKASEQIITYYISENALLPTLQDSSQRSSAPVQCSAVQRSAAQCSAVPLQSSPVQFNPVQ